MDVQSYLQMLIDWFLSNGLSILIIVLLTLVALKGARLILGRLFRTLSREQKDQEVRKRIDTLKSVVQYALTVTILAAACMMILNELGIAIGPVLAAAGIVGLAIGFGAQNLVQDVISGFFILMEGQIRVGDVVQVAGKGGLVEKVNLRMTVLRDLAGNVHYVRNGKIDLVTNMTMDFSYYLFEIGIAYREDVDEVSRLLREIDEELRNDPAYSADILAPLEILGLDKFAESSIIIKARSKTKPIKQWGVGREFNRRLKKKFDQRNIEIPFPHLTVYMGGGKETPRWADSG